MYDLQILELRSLHSISVPCDGGRCEGFLRCHISEEQTNIIHVSLTRFPQNYHHLVGPAQQNHMCCGSFDLALGSCCMCSQHTHLKIIQHYLHGSSHLCDWFHMFLCQIYQGFSCSLKKKVVGSKPSCQTWTNHQLPSLANQIAAEEVRVLCPLSLTTRPTTATPEAPTTALTEAAAAPLVRKFRKKEKNR